MFGDMEEKQKQLQIKLAGMTVEAQAGDGKVKVVASSNREIRNISIDKSLMEDGDAEQIEDFVMVAVNRALVMASELEAEEAQNLLKDMLPPGMGGLSGLFG